MPRKIYEEVHQDVQAEFDNVIATTGLEINVSIKVLGDERQKKEVIKVKKVDDINYHMHKEDVFLTVNQGIFEQLEPLQKIMAIEEALAQISFSHDKDAIISTPADVKTYSGVLSKYSYANYHVLQESIKTLYAKKEGEDKTK